MGPEIDLLDEKYPEDTSPGGLTEIRFDPAKDQHQQNSDESQDQIDRIGGKEMLQRKTKRGGGSKQRTDPVLDDHPDLGIVKGHVDKEQDQENKNILYQLVIKRTYLRFR